MPPQTGFDPSSAAQDKDFLNASSADKVKYLSAMDQDFAKASPQDQRNYIAHLSMSMQAPALDAFTAPPRQGAVGSILSDIGGLAKGAATLSANAMIPGVTQLIPEPVRQKLGIPSMNPITQGKQMVADYKRRKEAGYNLPYRIGAPVAEQLGTNVTGMEQAAQTGDVGGVIGHAAVPIVAALAHPVAKVANRVIPSTTRAGAGLNALTEAHADVPIGTIAKDAAIQNIVKDYAKLKTSVDPVTGKGLPEEIETYIKAREAHRAVGSDANMKQILLENNTPDPMTFGDAATRLKLINKLIRKSGGFESGPDALRIESLKRFAQAADEDIRTSIQNNPSLAQDYQRMMTEYGRGKQGIRAAEKAGPVVGGMAGAMAGKYLSPGLESVGLPPQMMQFAPLIGEAAGGALGMSAGKSILGRAARTLVERGGGPPRLRSLPSTPEAYHRTLLDAKEGRISPGEADRRIAAAGGKVRVRPIPQPTE